MKYLLWGFALLQLLTCSNVQKLRLESAPLFSEQTSWTSRQFTPAYQEEDLSGTYLTKIPTITQTHYHFTIAPKEQPQSAYTIKVRRSDLAIDGFIGSSGRALDVYLPLLQFPLFKGKTWQETIRIQEHPRRAVQKIPARFEVKEVLEYDYLPNEKLGAEKKAFFILVHLPNQVLSYHYLPADKKFPGTNIVDVYLQLDFLNANAPTMKNEVLEYQR